MKDIVLNANKGYQNPLNTYSSKAAEEFHKEKETDTIEPNKVRRPQPIYLYKQVENGVNVRLAKPVQLTFVRSQKDFAKSNKGKQPKYLQNAEGVKRLTVDHIG